MEWYRDEEEEDDEFYELDTYNDPILQRVSFIHMDSLIAAGTPINYFYSPLLQFAFPTSTSSTEFPGVTNLGHYKPWVFYHSRIHMTTMRNTA